jgi:hypothetical protein
MMPHPLFALLLAVLAASTAAVPAPVLSALASSPPWPRSSLAARACRCLPGAACWSSVPWAALNESVGGRLEVSTDPLAVCRGGGLTSAACDAALNNTDDEFWLSAQPNGYLHTGLFGAWNMSMQLSAYSVRAVSEADVQATVSFASAHNLRLVVKATGHDWFARSAAAGSLLLWTHLLSAIAFSNFSSGCAGAAAAVPAVTVGSGVQFRELYNAALSLGRVVMGGTCDSVSVGGCWLGGCYGTLSRLYGSGSSNLLQARVVLADGRAVVANECTNADLFWALRGGGGGLGGVVTEYVGRTHRAPDTLLLGGSSYAAADDEGWATLLEMQMNYSLAVMAPQWSGGGVGWSKRTVSFWPRGFELAPADGEALLAPFDALVKAQPARFSGGQSWTVWNRSTWKPGDGMPMMEAHPDREISTALLGSMSKYPVLRQIDTPDGRAAQAAALIALTRAMPAGVAGISGGCDFEKGQLGASPFALAQLSDSSVNPVVGNATGLFLVMYNVPSLPTLPPSSVLLRHLWPRLKQYVFLDPTDALYAICVDGTTGNETAAAFCFDEWRSVRAPAAQAQLATARKLLWDAFPNVDSEGHPFSGSYFQETDYTDDDWAVSHVSPLFPEVAPLTSVLPCHALPLHLCPLSAVGRQELRYSSRRKAQVRPCWALCLPSLRWLGRVGCQRELPSSKQRQPARELGPHTPPQEHHFHP